MKVIYPTINLLFIAFLIYLNLKITNLYINNKQKIYFVLLILLILIYQIVTTLISLLKGFQISFLKFSAVYFCLNTFIISLTLLITAKLKLKKQRKNKYNYEKVNQNITKKKSR